MRMSILMHGDYNWDAVVKQINFYLIFTQNIKII